MNIAVFFGGESCEHDISIITGVQLINNCDAYLYNIIPVYIDKNGDWYTGNKLKDIDLYSQKDFLKSKGVKKCTLLSNCKTLYFFARNKVKKYIDIDCAIICMHGLRGEDGCLAGVLEMCGIPYCSTSIMGSSICLDKGVFKTVCKGLGIECVDGFTVSENELLLDSASLLEKIEKFGFPIILKPCRQGSSIGVCVVKNSDDLQKSLKKSFSFDKKVLIEKFVNIDKEVNIALFEDKGKIVFSNTEEPKGNDVILSFNDKYLKNSGGFETIKRIVPADISTDCENYLKATATKLYRELELFGVVRFDFIVSSNKVYVNEINTIPGSMANYLFDKKSCDYSLLIQKLISNAIHRFNLNKDCVRVLDTKVLDGGFDFLKK